MMKKHLAFISVAFLGTVLANPFELKPEKKSQVRENAGYSVLGALAPADDKAETVQPKVKRPAKITAKKTFYDRKEGVAYFEGSVCVDDEQYKMNADKVYVFLDGTNDLRRIVAIGNVAMTNEMRRAYASKASYYKRNGMVVLDSGSGITAEVRDESKSDTQSVRGKKIKFWLSSEQVEVIDADITAPAGGAKGGIGSIKKDLLGK